MKVRATLICLCLFLTISLFFTPLSLKADGPSGGVVINEIMYDPLGSEVDEEYVELYNNASVSVNIHNWTFSDQDGSVDFLFTNIIFPPGAYIVMHTGSGTNDTDFSDGVAHFYMSKGSAMWGPLGDDVLLLNESGAGVDYVAYGDIGNTDPPPIDLNFSGALPWALEGNSISLHPNGKDGDSTSDWEESDPTPGYHNAHLYDLPPDITDIMHFPLNPTSSESVVVTASVSDDYHLDEVSVEYSVGPGSTIFIPMTFDGGNYTANIPSFAHGSEISYFIIAKDDSKQYSQSQTIIYAHSDSDFEIVINEFLPNPESDWNNDSFFDSDDEWIELYNDGDTVVNLGGWTIDDTLGSSGSSDPYMIPNGVFLRPKEFLVFYGNETGVVLNDFGEENVTLLDDEGNIIDLHGFSQTSDDTAMGRYPDGSTDKKNFLLPTPGEENQYPVDSLTNLSNVKINEFLPNPKSTYSKEWIELYNSGSQPVRLDGCYLDDIYLDGTKPWQIPLGTTLGPNEVIVFERTFGLNNAGDFVNLIYEDGSTIIDHFYYEMSEYDVSYARSGDGEDNWVLSSIPTPGANNVAFSGPDAEQRDIIITSLFYRSSEETEFVGLYNPSFSDVDLSLWRITDGLNSYSGTMIFPQGATIPSKDHMFVANNARIFMDIMGFLPDFEVANSSDQVTQMMGENPPSFALQSDEVRLLDSFGTLIDIVVYGESEYQDMGWMGEPVTDAKKGEYLKRNHDPGGPGYVDTNSSADWTHLRQYKVGQSDLDFKSFSYSGDLTVFASPDSSYETIIGEIEKAQSTIYLSMYEFTNWNISKAIIEKMIEGVKVFILMEGSPVGGISSDQKFVLQKIHENGGNIRYIVSNSTLGSRYDFLHAKYAVIDDLTLIISSENWAYTGIPVDSSYGNRGWGAVINNAQVACYFVDVFYEDWESVGYDLFLFTPEDPVYGNAPDDHIVQDFIEEGYYTSKFSSMTFSSNFTISPVLAPDTSLSETQGIIEMINSASETILIEQLDISLSWDGDKEWENSYLAAAISAAEERGVEVKILLSSRYASADDPKLDNYDTVSFINSYSENHDITQFLSARLVDYDRLGLSKLHNKGMVVDGQRTLISSINWVRNSVAQNREAGVIIESEEAADYFAQIFFWDWNEPPSAFAGSDMTVNTTDTISFNEPSFDPDGNIIGYFWDFDDGTNSTLKNPDHRFAKEGVYEVKLTVSDGQYSDSDTVTVIVTEAEATEGELGLVIYGALLFIFIVVFLTIITFLRRMRFRFL